jgi:hypothetical protein
MLHGGRSREKKAAGQSGSIAAGYSGAAGDAGALKKWCQKETLKWHLKEEVVQAALLVAAQHGWSDFFQVTLVSVFQQGLRVEG